MINLPAFFIIESLLLVHQELFTVLVCSMLIATVNGNESTTAAINLFVCDFESGTRGLVSDATASFTWTRAAGIATDNVLNTGPISGQGGSTWYYFIDSSGQAYGNEARFATQPLNYIGSVCIEFYYLMFGQTINTLGIYIQILGSSRVQIWSLQGPQGNAWLIQRSDVNLTSYNATIGWRAVVGTNQNSNIAVDSIRIFTGSCPPTKISLPFSCDFESPDLCQMASSPLGDIDWVRQMGAASSILNTGPTGAESGSYYLLMNASYGFQSGDRAIIEVLNDWIMMVCRVVTLPVLYSGLACVQFFYHMWGVDVNKLMVISSTLGFAFPWLTLSGNKGNQWLSTNITVSLSNNTDQIGFVAVRGTSVLSDVAIDNIQVIANQCPGDTSFDNSVDLPFTCTFELDFCGMTSFPLGNFTWTRTSGKADTLDNGPSSVFEGSYYIYAPSAPRQPGDKAYFSTPGLRFSGDICVRFAYFINGSGVGTLQVYTRFYGESHPVFNKSSDQGNLWFEASIDIRIVYADAVIFVATLGSSVFGDIAVDYLLVTPQTCDSSGPYVTTTTTQLPPDVNYTGPIVIAPFISCDMERNGVQDTQCRLYQDPNGNFPWLQNSGRTPSGRISNRSVNGVQYPVTGPESACQGLHYAYIEASGQDPGSLARLIVMDDSISDTKCLQFCYTMNGFYTGILRVYRIISDISKDYVWIMSGDQLPGWKTATVEIDMISVTEIGIEAITAFADDAFSGDTSLDNVTLSLGSCNAQLWLCNFETASGASTMCTLQANRYVDFAWTLWTGKTLSAETGPSSAFNGLYYIYAEASSPRVQGDVAETKLPLLSFNGTVCLAFYYHMWGFHVGSLQVYTVDVTNNGYFQQWSIFGDQGNLWIEARVTIQLFQPTYQVAIRATRGSAFTSDIAIDNIRLTSGQC